MINAYQNIRKRRLELEMSQEKLASLTGYSDRSSIAKIESGAVDISISKLQEFANALKTTSSALMGLTNFEQVSYTTYPLIPDSAAAGTPTDESYYYELPHIQVPNEFLGRYAGNKNIVIVKVNGESMNKIIPDQSYIAVKYLDYDYKPANGDIVLFRELGGCGGLSVKRFYDIGDSVFLRPESTYDEFDDIKYLKEDSNFQILGKVVMYNVTLD